MPDFELKCHSFKIKCIIDILNENNEQLRIMKTFPHLRSSLEELLTTVVNFAVQLGDTFLLPEQPK